MSGSLTNETIRDPNYDWWSCPAEAPKSWQVAQRVAGLFFFFAAVDKKYFISIKSGYFKGFYYCII